MMTRQQTAAGSTAVTLTWFRRESGFYPPGAEFDPRAPYNQEDEPDEEEEEESEDEEDDDE